MPTVGLFPKAGPRPKMSPASSPAPETRPMARELARSIRASASGDVLPSTRSGLTKVKAEAALRILAYNILHAINLIGAPNLRARLA